MRRAAVLGLALGWALGCGGATPADPGGSPGGGDSEPVPSECAGTSGTGAYRGSFCGSSLFINTSALSCPQARADCMRQAAANPARSIFCTWNNRVIYRADTSAGACNTLVCDSVLGQGQYRGSFCGSFAFANTPDSTCQDALTNCESNAQSNPDMSVYCTWQGQEIYRREKTAGACPR